MIVFLAVSIFMFAYFIIEKYHIYKVKSGINDLKKEITDLKAKLYDKSSNEGSNEPNLLPESSMDEDETGIS